MRKNYRVNPMRTIAKMEEETDDVFQYPKVEGIFIDDAHNEISIIGTIKDGSYNDFRVLFSELVDKQYEKKEDLREPIVVYISSNGGDAIQALNIVNEIQSAQMDGITVYTKAGDSVMSAALLIFMCGSIRLCNRYTHFLFHQISGGCRVDEFIQQERNRDFTLLIWNEFKRLTIENTNVDEAWIEDKYNHVKDFAFFGYDAVELGFADASLQPPTVLDRGQEEELEVEKDTIEEM